MAIFMAINEPPQSSVAPTRAKKAGQASCVFGISCVQTANLRPPLQSAADSRADASNSRESRYTRFPPECNPNERSQDV